jgi:MFS family permease
MFMTGIAGAFVGGALSDRWGRSGGAALIFSLSGACAFALGWTRGSPLIALGFAYGFLTAADSAIYLTAVTELAPARQRGSAQALQSLAGFGLGALSPIVAGAILDTATSPSAWGLAFSFNGALAVAGVIALLMLRRLPEAARMTAAKR